MNPLRITMLAAAALLAGCATFSEDGGFGSVEDILKAAETMKPSSKRDKLLQDKANALLSKQLVTVKRDVEIDVDIEQLRYQGPDRAALR